MGGFMGRSKKGQKLTDRIARKIIKAEDLVVRYTGKGKRKKFIFSIHGKVPLKKEPAGVRELYLALTAGLILVRWFDKRKPKNKNLGRIISVGLGQDTIKFQHPFGLVKAGTAMSEVNPDDTVSVVSEMGSRLLERVAGLVVVARIWDILVAEAEPVVKTRHR